jgi:putative hydrolase
MVERARRGELLRLTLGEDRWQLVERMQAAMSLIEGHAEHTMDVIGVEVLPSLTRLRAAMTRRRGQRGLPWRVLERLMGLELKMRQYEIGRAFCDEVVRDGGPQMLARAWSGPEALPSTAELEQPALWLSRMRPAELEEQARTHVPPVTS